MLYNWILQQTLRPWWKKSCVLIPEEIHGEAWWGRNKQEKKKALSPKEHINLNIPATGSLSTLDFLFYVPALYLPHCTVCHTKCCTAKADLVMLHPGETFLFILLATPSWSCVMAVGCCFSWIFLILILSSPEFVQLLMPGLFPHTIVLSMLSQILLFQKLSLVWGFKVMHLLVYLRPWQFWWGISVLC